MGVRQLLIAWLHAPDLPGILGNGPDNGCHWSVPQQNPPLIGQLLPVRAELAAAGNVVYGHLCPLGGVPVHGASHVLAGDVRLVVSQRQELVVIQQHIHQDTELALLAGGQETFSVNVNNLECNNT